MGSLLLLCDALDALLGATSCLAELGFSVGNNVSLGPFERNDAVVALAAGRNWAALLGQVKPDDFRTVVLLMRGPPVASEIAAAFRSGVTAVVAYTNLQEIGVGLSRCVAWQREVEHSSYF